MATITDAGTRRPVITYIIIAVILFVALFGSVRFAKNRASVYAPQPVGQSQSSGNQGEQKPQTGTSVSDGQNTTPSASTQQNPTPAATPTTGPSTAPGRVPSTGPEQIALPILSLSLLAFASISYVRARRRLQTIFS